MPLVQHWSLGWLLPLISIFAEDDSFESETMKAVYVSNLSFTSVFGVIFGYWRNLTGEIVALINSSKWVFSSHSVVYTKCMESNTSSFRTQT